MPFQDEQISLWLHQLDLAWSQNLQNAPNDTTSRLIQLRLHLSNATECSIYPRYEKDDQAASFVTSEMNQSYPKFHRLIYSTVQTLFCHTF